MHWADTPIHFVDFEGNATSGILEYGVVSIHGSEVVAARTRLCRPKGRVTPEDTAVHGLRAEDLREEAPFGDEWEYFAGLRGNGPLAAHFSSAEDHLIRSVWPYPRTVPDFARAGRTANEWGPWIDTGRLYPQLFPALGGSKLEQLIAVTGQQALLDLLAARHCPAARRHFHAALYDALAGTLLLRALLGRSEYADATIPWLLQMSTLSPEKRGALQQDEMFG